VQLLRWSRVERKNSVITNGWSRDVVPSKSEAAVEPAFIRYCIVTRGFLDETFRTRVADVFDAKAVNMGEKARSVIVRACPYLVK
jgi:hypothetical protein